MQQASEFRDECRDLYELIEPLAPDQYERKTQFKGWTLNQILRHLHTWNQAANLSLDNEQAALVFFAKAMPAISGNGFNAFEEKWCDGLAGPALLEAWQQLFLVMAARFEQADPKTRVKWAGPDMSVRSSITARLMETWAHGQAIYDLLGVARVDTDRIRSIAILGINTFGWAFKNRGLPVPDKIPYVELLAPSGALWRWGEPDQRDRVQGSATGFCQIVAQTRNIEDTDMAVTGPIARQWMSIAQCFAGPPADPPKAGSRFVSGAQQSD